MRTMEMFDKPRKKREHLMHVVDCGTGNCDGLSDGEEVVVMSRKKCGHGSGWITMPNVTAARRGIPCPHCNRLEDDNGN